MNENLDISDRAVIVQARSLDDLIELAHRASERLDPTDPLTLALRGAIGQVRADLVVEP